MILLPRRTVVVASLIVMAVGGTAHAQAPINSNVALQPSKGGLIIRQQLRFTEADHSTPAGDLDIRLTSSITTFVYGLSDEFTFIAEAPIVLSRRTDNNTTRADDTDSGFADMRLLSKLRLFRDDFGATDTRRFDLIAGLDVPTGNHEFTSDSADPIVGGVFTHIEGRHSFHADALWHFNTGGGADNDDLLRCDLAYLYRLAPEVYASRRPTALFGSLELNGFYETNGDHELFLSPGIQYVTTRWIIEATVQIPVWQDLSHRPERGFVVGVGFRVQF